MTTPSLSQLREAAERAYDVMAGLASGRIKHVRMSIPPQPDDDDMLVCGVLKEVPALIARIEALEEALRIAREYIVKCDGRDDDPRNQALPIIDRALSGEGEGL